MNPINNNAEIEKEIKNCFNFFWDYSNHNKDQLGYGLIVDRSGNKTICSIAAVGFGLSAFVIGSKKKYLDEKIIKDHVRATLITLRDNIKTYHGLYPHFVDMTTAKAIEGTEISTIDTSLLLNGIITVESYYNCPEISNIANDIISRIDWKHFMFKSGLKTLFHMAYNDNVKGDYVESGKAGFIHQWDHYAEHLTMYMHAALDEKITDEELKELYIGFDRPVGSYKSNPFVFPHGNPLFIHQFSHGWFPFQKYDDEFGFNWFDNSINATKSHIQYCKDKNSDYLNKGLFGFSAGDIENGYGVSGVYPIINPSFEAQVTGDGTIQQYSMLSSINFCPEETLKALSVMVSEYPQSYANYGFTDGMNPSTGWYSNQYLGIDKGITIIMLENYQSGLIWDVFEQSKYIKKAINRLKFKEKQ